MNRNINILSILLVWLGVSAAITVLSLVSCDRPSGPMQVVGTAEGPCEDFSGWSEITSPFEGERCFLFNAPHTYDGGVVCKRSESVYLKACADPKKRPDRPEPSPQDAGT